MAYICEKGHIVIKIYNKKKFTKRLIRPKIPFIFVNKSQIKETFFYQLWGK